MPGRLPLSPSRSGSGGLSPRMSPRLPSIDEKKGDDQGFLVPPIGASHHDAAGWAVEGQGCVRPLDVPPGTAHGFVSAVADGGESRRAAALPDDAARLEAAERSCYHARQAHVTCACTQRAATGGGPAEPADQCARLRPPWNLTLGMCPQKDFEAEGVR